MPTEQLIVIGGSAGAVTTVLEMARNLPRTFHVPICIVIHLHADSRSVLPALLESASGLVSKHPESPEILQPGHIYVAPPDHHMIIQQHEVLLNRDAHENRSRPAIDPLFRSAAMSFGPRLVAVLLSGYLDDGTAGLLSVQKLGGRIIIQDPNDTPFGDMPTHALEYVEPDCVLKVGEIVPKLLEFTSVGSSRMPATDRVLEADIDIGKLSGLICPHCSGVMWEISDNELLNFRCHEGHSFSPQSLRASQNEALENALWIALRALDEKRALTERLLKRADELQQTLALKKYRDVLDLTNRQSYQVRRILKDSAPPRL